MLRGVDLHVTLEGRRDLAGQIYRQIRAAILGLVRSAQQHRRSHFSSGWIDAGAPIRRMLADAAAGQGGVVLIEGEPGVGKSSLLKIGLAPAPGLGCGVYTATPDEVSQRFPLQVMLECLRLEADAPARARTDIADVLHAELRSDMGWAGDPVVAASERLLVHVDELCAASPVVIAVDDLQWADEASLMVWHRLGQLANQTQLLLVGACRPVPRRAELAKVRRQVTARGGSVISLAGLSDEEGAELLTRLLDTRPGPELRRFVDHTAGNPLYLRELTEALLHENAVRVAGGTAELESWSAAESLMSLSSVIARRLDFMSRETSELMRTAALIGNEFAVTDLATILERTPADLMAGLQDALAAGVIVDAGDRLAFRHPLISSR
jgi:AAA ATPase domain